MTKTAKSKTVKSKTAKPKAAKPKAAKTTKPKVTKTKAPAKAAAKAPAKKTPAKPAAKKDSPKASPKKTAADKKSAKAVPPLKKTAVTEKSAPDPVSIPRKKVALANVTALPPDYDPRKDKGDFMNPVMSEYFRQKLIRWREELLRESNETIHNTLQGTELQKPDLADRASAETDHALELRTRDRERKLITKINEALLRIEDGTYGYCEETGEPIAVARLDARPTATLSLEAQERHERMERTHRDE